ncbi:hypothetical protein [Pantoea sp. ARC607]|uniref:hypothetical protein n=1 Tax=unclassified Pantoea TaxID=2630326 RepID=UPI0011B49F13|nr:hypothetical protein [Pantoea sp. ARC607]
MSGSEEEKVNIIIGEATFTLLENDDYVGARALVRQLTQMLEIETEADRRQSIKEAIRQISRLITAAIYSDKCCTEIKSLSRTISGQSSMVYW